jgi:hypothetical protein
MKTSRIETDEKTGKITVTLKEGDCVMSRMEYDGTQKKIAESAASGWKKGTYGSLNE